MHNYHCWTVGLGKRNIQCLIFALSLLNYIIDTKSIVCKQLYLILIYLFENMYIFNISV